MAKKGDKPLPQEKIGDTLNPKQELFCQYYAQNQELFGNATLSYAEAYDYKLDTLSKDDAKYKTVKGKKVLIERSTFGKAENVCAVMGARLLRNAKIQSRITALLNELLRDDIVDSQLAKVITQDSDLQSKVRAINEYNKVRGRIIDKTRDVTERFAVDDIRELLAPLPQERQDEIYAILTTAIGEAEALRSAAQIQKGHTQ